MLALALVSAAALGSLYGTEQTQRFAASPFFIIGAALVGIASLIAGIAALAGRRWTSVLLHFGLVLALAGIAVNQRATHPGYLFLERGGAGRNLYISRDLRRASPSRASPMTPTQARSACASATRNSGSRLATARSRAATSSRSARPRSLPAPASSTSSTMSASAC